MRSGIVCLVEEQDAAVGQGGFAGPGDPSAAADHGRGGGGVVRGAQRRAGDQRVAGCQQASGGVDRGHLHRLARSERGHEGSNACGQSGDMGTTAAGQAQVVAACRPQTALTRPERPSPSPAPAKAATARRPSDPNVKIVPGQT